MIIRAILLGLLMTTLSLAVGSRVIDRASSPDGRLHRQTESYSFGLPLHFLHRRKLAESSEWSIAHVPLGINLTFWMAGAYAFLAMIRYQRRLQHL